MSELNTIKQIENKENIRFVEEKRYAIVDYSRNVPVFFYHVLKRTEKTITFFDEVSEEKIRRKIKISNNCEYCSTIYGDICSKKIYHLN